MAQENPNFIMLSPADRQLIEEDHARLRKFLCDLCDTCGEPASAGDCQHCGHEKFASCKGLLPSFFYDFQDILAVHFETEERIMSGIPHTETTKAYFQQHQDDHALLMLELHQLMQESIALIQHGNAGEAIRKFQQLIRNRLHEQDDFLAALK